MPATTVDTLIFELKVNDQASKVFDAWDNRLKSIQISWDRFVGSIGNIALSGITALTNGFKKLASVTSDFVVDAVKNFANYEDILTQAARTLDLTTEEARELGIALTHLANEALRGGVMSEELARIAGVAGQLGVAKEDVLGFTETVAMMSRAFGISAEKAAEGMAIILNVFQLTQEEMNGVGSAIAFLGNSTAATADQIIRISQKMGGVANFFGLTAEQTAAIAATLRDVGVSVGVAGSSMSQILSRIMSEHTKFAEVLGLNSENLKRALESNDPSQALFMVLDALNQINSVEGKIAATQALKDLGLTGVRTQSSMLLLAGSVEELRQNMENAEAASEKGAELQNLYNKSIETAKGRWSAFKEAISTVQKIVGGPLATAFSNFLNNHITPIIKRFARFLEHSELFNKIMGEMLPKALETAGLWVDKLGLAFIDFLLEIDRGGVFFDNFKAKAIEVFNDIWGRIETTVNKFLAFITDIERVSNSVQEMGQTAGIVFETLKGTAEDLSNVINFMFGDMIRMAGQAASAIGPLIDKMLGLDKAVLQTEEDATGNSLFPDMVSWAEIATGTIDELKLAIEAMDAAVVAGEMSVDAIGQSFEAMAAKGMLAVRETMEETAKAVGAIGGFAGMSSAGIRQLAGSTGILSPEATREANEEIRRRQPGEFFKSQATSQQGAQTMSANIFIGGEEIAAVVTPLVNDQNEQNGRRSF
jgi:TP901 family phage tail tape measure protein